MTSPLTQAARALVANQAQCDCYDDLLPEAQERARETVRAVLGAIREPDDLMIMAGIAERHEQPVPEAWNLATENIWRAMLDAALTEATQERTR